MRRFTPMSPLSLSPDGKLVAYSLVDVYSRSFSTKEEIRTDRGVPAVVSGSELFVSELSSGQARRIAGGRGNSAWSARWSADGRALAYFSDDDGELSLWVWSRATDRSRRVMRARVRPGVLDGPRWTPDGSRLIVKTASRAAENGAGDATAPVRGARTQVFVSHPESTAGQLDTRARSSVVAQWSVSDLAVVDVATGSVHVLARDQPVVSYWVSPDGRLVAYSRMRTDLRPGANINAFDIVVVPVDSGTSRIVVRGIAHGMGAMVSWAPDGRRLAFYSAPGREADTLGVLPRGSYVVRADGDSLRLTGLSASSMIGLFDVPLWDDDGRNIYAVADGRLYRMLVGGDGAQELQVPRGREVLGVAARAQDGRLWAPDGKHAVVVTRDTTTYRQALVRVPLAGGTPEVIYEEEQMLLGSAATNADVFRLDALGEQLVIARETAADPPDLWAYDVSAETGRRVTRANPKLSKYRFGTSRLVSWLSDDGVPLRGAILLPPDYTPTKRYPVLVCVYGGGRLSRSAFSFGGFLSSMHDAQIFATRGYAVFFPDAPQQFGAPLQDLAKTVLPGVSRLIEMGIADGDRLAIAGHSYGGYSVYSILTQTPRFRAAVVSAGVSNLTSAYGIMVGTTGMEEYFEGGQGKIGASLWEARDRYIDNSPLFHFDRVRTPVLIIHGARDTSVPLWSADQAFLALRRLGREVEYVRYLDEAHSEWTGPASADRFSRMLDFLARHVGSGNGAVDSALGGDTRP